LKNLLCLKKVLGEEVETLDVAWRNMLKKDPTEAFEKAAERFKRRKNLAVLAFGRL